MDGASANQGSMAQSNVNATKNKGKRKGKASANQKMSARAKVSGRPFCSFGTKCKSSGLIGQHMHPFHSEQGCRDFAAETGIEFKLLFEPVIPAFRTQRDVELEEARIRAKAAKLVKQGAAVEEAWDSAKERASEPADATGEGDAVVEGPAAVETGGRGVKGAAAMVMEGGVVDVAAVIEEQGVDEDGAKATEEVSSDLQGPSEKADAEGGDVEGTAGVGKRLDDLTSTEATGQNSNTGDTDDKMLPAACTKVNEDGIGGSGGDSTVGVDSEGSCDDHRQVTEKQFKRTEGCSPGKPVKSSNTVDALEFILGVCVEEQLMSTKELQLTSIFFHKMCRKIPYFSVTIGSGKGEVKPNVVELACWRRSLVSAPSASSAPAPAAGGETSGAPTAPSFSVSDAGSSSVRLTASCSSSSASSSSEAITGDTPSAPASEASTGSSSNSNISSTNGTTAVETKKGNTASARPNRAGAGKRKDGRGLYDSREAKKKQTPAPDPGSRVEPLALWGVMWRLALSSFPRFIDRIPPGALRCVVIKTREDDRCDSLTNIVWPDTLERLSLEGCFDRSVDGVRWPPRLRLLKLGGWFDQPLDGVTWPSSLKELILGERFNQPMTTAVDWPTSLERLCLENFRQPIANVQWPRHLEQLSLLGYFNSPIAKTTWPTDLKVLWFGHSFQQSVHGVKWPPSLRELLFTCDLYDPLPSGEGAWPPGLCVMAGDVVKHAPLQGETKGE